MARSIEQRIVEMQFNNQQFENGAKESLSTLDKLKEKLNILPETAKSLDKLGDFSAASGISKLGEGVVVITEKFSALEQIAIGALRRIGEQALDAGAHLVKGLTIDQVSAGWDKYAQKTSSVQTIMSATRKEFEEMGMSQEEQMAAVNEQLEKLNWFTDETSYNYLDMVNNIGKFTNNGVQLEDAVTSMQGIATWAAISGANTQEASRAMYNLSQAMGVGAVTLIDWKSIENANMATMEFKEMAIQAALARGELEDLGDGWYAASSGGGDPFDINSFNKALTEGKWLTREVLTDTLGQYGNFATLLNEAQDSMGYDTTTALLKDIDAYRTIWEYGGNNFDLFGDPEEWNLEGFDKEYESYKRLQEILKETGMTAEELHGTFGILASDEYDLGRRAFKAAQEAKTFQEALDATFDAVSTKWLNIFEIIFGDYLEAKEIWSALAEELYTVFVSPLDGLVELLEGWRELEGREALFEGIANIWSAIGDIFGIVAKAFRDVFPPMTSERLADLTKGFRDFAANLKLNEEYSGFLREIFLGLFSAIDLGIRIVGAVVKGLSPLGDLLALIGDRLIWVGSHIGRFFTDLSVTFSEFGLFEHITNGVRNALDSLLDGISAFSLGLGFGNIYENITDIGGAIIDFFDYLTGAFLKFARFIENTFGGDKEVLAKPFELHPLYKFGEGVRNVAGIIVKPLGAIKTAITSLVAFNPAGKIKEAFNFGSFFDGLAKVIGTAIGYITNGIAKLLSFLGKGLGGVDFNSVFDFISSGVLVTVGLGLKNIFDSISDVFGDSGIGGILENVVGILDGVKGCFEAWQRDLQAKTLLKIAAAIGILTIALKVLSGLNVVQLGVSLTAMGILFTELVIAMRALVGISEKVKGMKLTSLAVSMMIISAAVLMLAGAMKSLGGLDWEQLGKGVVGIGALVGIMVIATKLMSSGKKMTKGLSGLVMMAFAIRLLVKPLKEFSSFNLQQIGTSLAMLGGSMLILAGALRLMPKKTLSLGVGLLLVATAMKGLAKAMSAFAGFDLMQVGTSLAMLAASMVILAVGLHLMPKGMVGMGAGLMIISLALGILAGVMKIFATFDIVQLGTSLAMLAGSLVILAVGLTLMKGTLAGAAALLVASVAIMALAPALMLLGMMSLGTIVKSLIALGGALAVLGIASIALAPAVVPMLAFGAAIALIGAGVLAVGSALMMFSIAGFIDEIAGAIAGLNGNMIIAFLKQLIMLIPEVAVSLAKSIVEFIRTIGEGAVVIVEAVVNIGRAIISGVTALVPDFVNMVVVVLNAILGAMATHGPSLLNKAIDIFIGILTVISERTPEIVAVVVNCVLAVLEALSVSIPYFVDAAAKLVISFIEGMSSAIRENTPLLVEAVGDLIQTVIEAIEFALLSFVEALPMVDKIPGVSDWIANSKKGIEESWAAKEEGKKLAEQEIEGITEGFEEKGPEVSKRMGVLSQETIDVGKDAITQFKEVGTGQGEAQGNAMLDGIMGKLQEYTDVNTMMSKMGSESFGADANVYSDISALMGGNAISGIEAATPNFALANAEMAAAGTNELHAALPEYDGVVQEMIGKPAITAQQTAPEYAAAMSEMANTGPNMFAETKPAFEEMMASISALPVDSVRANIPEMELAYDDLSRSGLDNLTEVTPEYQAAAEANADAMVGPVRDEIPDYELAVQELNDAGLAKIKEGTADYEAATVEKADAVINAMESKTPEFELANAEMSNKGLEAQKTNVTGYEQASKDKVDAATKGVKDNAVNFEAANKELANKGVDEVYNAKIIEMYRQAGIEDTEALEKGLREGTIKPEQATKDLTEIMFKNVTEVANKKVADMWRESGYEDAESMAKGIEEGTILAQDAAAELARRAEEELNDLGESGYRSGKAFGDGVAEGIRDKEGSVSSAAAALAHAANAAFNAALQIESPSKVMVWSGRMFDKGVAVGMLSEVGTVAKAGGSVANAAMESVRDGLSDMTTMLDDDMDFNPVIRPVMDLSDVQNGAAQMGGMFGNFNPGFTATGLMTPESRMFELMHGFMDRMNQQEPYGDINIYVQPGDGVDANEVAELTMRKLNTELQRRKAAWG